jgi:HEPN domain-containing protein
VNQADLQSQAQERILDADALIKGGRWSFAFYVAGYAVECALKSCLLARMIYTGWVFQEKAKIIECLTHNFGELIKLSGLKDELDARLAANPAFVGNWAIITQWKVTDRYGQKTEADAKALYAAITDEPDGVLKWIMNYW